jgi:hypothetical protein
MLWDGSPGDCARANAIEKTTSAYEHACGRGGPNEIRDHIRADKIREPTGQLDPRFHVIPPPESARVPIEPCGRGYGLKPDRNGFGRWTCQPLGVRNGAVSPTPLTPEQEEAEVILAAATIAIFNTRTAKDNDLLKLLKFIEDSFREAAKKYAAAGDTDNHDAAAQEASRIAAVRFLEGHGGSKPPTLRECAMTIELFPSLNRADPQSADLVKRVANLCEGAIRQGH